MNNLWLLRDLRKVKKPEDMHKNLTSSQLLAEKYLKEIGFLAISTNNTVLTMEKSFIVNTKANKIIVTIGTNFPIEYPKFYTKDNLMFLMYPHIEQKSLDMDAHGICLFDENDKLYYEYPDYLLQDNLNRLDGFLKKIEDDEFTQAEIFEEFDSYWNSTGFTLHYNKNYLQEYNDIKLVDGIIDDFSRVQRSRKKEILQIEDVPKDAIVLWVATGSPLEVKKRLDAMGLKNISYLAFYRYSKLDLAEPPFILDFKEDFQNNRAQYEATYKLLSDEKSKEVFVKVLNFKISFDYNFMEGFTNDHAGQYFEKELIGEIEGIRFVDAGGYVGDTCTIDLYISKNKPNIYLIDEKEKVNKYFNATNTLYDKKKIIYINFHEKFPSKIPVNYKEFLDAIEYAGYSKQFKSLKKHNNLHSSILFSFNLPRGDLHFASLYIKPTQIKINKKVKIINPITDMTNMLKYNTPLLGGSAKDTSSNRVYTRGGNRMNEVINNKAKKIAIVGCGSIGASLAFKLLKTGCTNLLLIDPQRLSVDNIARHILGMEYVNLYKAEALENFLKKQFIETNIKSIPKNVIDCFEELKSCDLIISALGSEAKAVETKMVKDTISNNLPPLISCWLEANAVAGHSILFNNNQQTFSKEIPFDIDTFFNSLTILKDDYAKSLYKDDVGCNSSYMPYSFLSADIHINHFAHMVVKNILEEDIQPVLSSIGDLSNLKQYIKNEYKDLNSFSLLTKVFNE